MDYLVVTEFPFYKAREFFCIDSEDTWYARAQLIKETLKVYRPDILYSYEHLRGIRTLFRNVAFLLVVLILISPAVRGSFYLSSCMNQFGLLAYLKIVGLALVLAAGAMFVASVVAVYYTYQVLAKTYILCVSLGIEKGFQGLPKGSQENDSQNGSRNSDADHDGEIARKIEERITRDIIKTLATQVPNGQQK